MKDLPLKEADPALFSLIEKEKKAMEEN